MQELFIYSVEVVESLLVARLNLSHVHKVQPLGRLPLHHQRAVHNAEIVVGFLVFFGVILLVPSEGVAVRKVTGQSVASPFVDDLLSLRKRLDYHIPVLGDQEGCFAV